LAVIPSVAPNGSEPSAHGRLKVDSQHRVLLEQAVDLLSLDAPP